MPNDKLNKNVKLTQDAHAALIEAAEARYGTRRIRFSDVIETLCEEEVARQEADE